MQAIKLGYLNIFFWIGFNDIIKEFSIFFFMFKKKIFKKIIIIWTTLFNCFFNHIRSTLYATSLCMLLKNMLARMLLKSQIHICCGVRVTKLV
jgi:hypothetical protein